MKEIIKLAYNDIAPDMLRDFKHEQLILRKYIYTDGLWTEKETHELRQWSAEKRVWITEYLRRQVQRGGSAAAAIADGKLIGFASVDGTLNGETAKYANLTMLFVDDEMKRKGIGTALFREACICAKNLGAEKLFISAIPSVETVAFYGKMGCVDAEEIVPAYIDTENDRYLEYAL